ncbi:hypothetical protein N0V87_003441 [Didymella glomerata]|uniref:Uncharacterized protein n=1 Tax=Didymella glomerata TaxID=749621 RepID=A0A9W8X411_9PLEO|nr:hypothetical protein N0V87_003441 [Didymella glomerata]
MAPIAIPVSSDIREKGTAQPKKDSLGRPEAAKKRLEKAGIDLSNGADPEQRALLGAAKEVIQLTAHISTEILGLQLKELTN